jgi:hypothetical protein
MASSGARRRADVQGIDRGVVIGCIAGALLLALPLLSTRVLVSWHGYFHAALTEQVALHGVPATNPGLAGEPIDYQWAFHALPALLAETAAIDPLRALLGLNIAWIVVAGVGAAEVARAAGLSRTLQRLAPLALFGALNTAAPLVLLVKRIKFGVLPANDWNRGEWIDWLSQRAIPRNGADISRSLWDVRASCFAKEFLDASAMATGLVLVVVGLALVVEAARAPRGRSWLLAPLVMVEAFVYPQLLPVVVAAIAALALVHLLPRTSEPAARPRVAIALAGACALALLAAGPYLAAITSRARFDPNAAATPFVALEGLAAIFKNGRRFAALAALLPFGLLAAPRLAKRWRDPAVRLLLVAAAADLALVVAIRMVQGTEYKFLFAAAVPVALLALIGLEATLARAHARPRRRNALLAAIALIFAGPTVVFLVGALASGHFHQEALALHGRTFTRLPAQPLEALLERVRRELPADTLLVADSAVSEKSPNNDAFAPAAIAARDLYRIDDRELTRPLRSFHERSNVTTDLLNGSDVEAATAAIRLLHRPVALLFTSALRPDFRPIPDDEWLRTVFGKAGWRLFDHRDGADLVYLPAAR